MDNLKRELIIDVKEKNVELALLENKELVELHKEELDNKFSVGDIYLGRVRKIMPGLNAAFVNIGYEKDAFLHYSALGINFLSFNKIVRSSIEGKSVKDWTSKIDLERPTEKDGVLSDFIKPGDIILVQIIKEAISTKGPRISAEVTMAGRNIVLVPFSNKVSISQKIASKAERSRLENLLKSILPKNFGVIIRTVAQEKKVAELDSELKGLVKQWNQIPHKIRNSTAPKLVQSEMNRAAALIRDIFDDSFSKVHVNNKSTFVEIVDYIKSIAPEKTGVVKYYNNDKVSIFNNFAVTSQIKKSLGEIVNIKNGAYLVIQHTEALHVIDVNSGNRSQKKTNQEENALRVNLAAAKEIARQLRLRDLGGIIVIDFIDLHLEENKKRVFDFMQEEMKRDKTKHTITPLSKFCLMELTRQRFRPELKIDTSELCPSCKGKGRVESTVVFAEKIKTEVLAKAKLGKTVNLEVHPIMHGYLTKGLFSIAFKWMIKSKVRIRVVPNMSFEFLEYKIK